MILTLKGVFLKLVRSGIEQTAPNLNTSDVVQCLTTCLSTPFSQIVLLLLSDPDAPTLVETMR